MTRLNVLLVLAVVARRMSSGPSKRKEKPLPGLSI